jgi:hypothetical protein
VGTKVTLYQSSNGNAREGIVATCVFESMGSNLAFLTTVTIPEDLKPARFADAKLYDRVFTAGFGNGCNVEGSGPMVMQGIVSHEKARTFKFDGADGKYEFFVVQMETDPSEASGNAIEIRVEI